MLMFVCVTVTEQWPLCCGKSGNYGIMALFCHCCVFVQHNSTDNSKQYYSKILQTHK